MNLKYRRYIERIEALITEGRQVAKLQRGPDYETFIGHNNLDDKTALLAWLTKVENILINIFTESSPHILRFKEYRDNGVNYSYEVHAILGILTGAKDDLENGFLLGQEFIVAGIVFDSILEEADYLNKNGFKDPAAVLSRVVLEKALKKIAEEIGINSEKKASVINDLLRKEERYNQPLWRQIQAWLDIGNSAAHGKFDEFTQDEASSFISGVESFIATELR